MSTQFKIICTGWKNWPWVQDTVNSILLQDNKNYDVCLVDDASQDQVLSDYIETTCGQYGWKFILNDQHKRAPYNQVHGIRLMEPEPEDVIVFLDPDGDMFANAHVLDRLEEEYADGTRLAYSKYQPYPDSPGSTQSRPYPDHVIQTNTYREFSRVNGIFWNHLRTMKADLFLQMNDGDFQHDDGTWFGCGTDSAFMFPGLELARGRVKFIDEVLMLYRADHELSDWRRYPVEVDEVHGVILTRPPKC